LTVDPDDEEMIEHFGKLPTTMFTLFKAVFGGFDWAQVLGPLERMGFVYAALFVVYVSVMSLAVLNIVTGVFVENTMNSAHQDTDFMLQDFMDNEDSALQSIKELFDEIDTDNTGEISEAALEELLASKRTQAYFQAVGVHVTKARGLFRLLDTDMSGTVSLEEFAIGCLRLRGDAKTVDLVTLMYENRRVIRAVKGLMQEVSRAQVREAPVAWAPPAQSLVPLPAAEGPERRGSPRASIAGDDWNSGEEAAGAPGEDLEAMAKRRMSQMLDDMSGIFGLTQGCARCDLRKDKQPAGEASHSQGCRRRLERMMRDDERSRGRERAMPGKECMAVLEPPTLEIVLNMDAEAPPEGREPMSL